MIKKLLLSILVIVLVCLGGGLWFGKRALESWIEDSINQEAARSGVKVQTVRAGFTGFSVDSVQNAIQPVEDVRIKIDWMSVLQRQPAASLTAAIAGGRLIAKAENLARDTPITIDIKLENVELAKLSKLQGMSVSAGTLNAAFKFAANDAGTLTGTGTIVVANGTKSAPTFLPGIFIGRREGLQIPAFTDLAANLTVTLDRASSSWQITELRSSLFDARGSLTTMNPSARGSNAPNGEITLQLTPTGMQTLPPILLTLFGADISPNARRYQIRISNGQVDIVPSDS